MLLHRRLTLPEATLLHEELKTTPNILGYTVRELAAFRDVVVAEVDGALAGVSISKDLLFGWTDIAVIYVLPTHRGQGLGRLLFAEAWRHAVERGRHIVALSRSPEVIHLMEQFGMRVSRSVLRAPPALHLHMHRHLMSRHRLRESIRKSRTMKFETPLHVGVWRRHE